LCVFISWTNKEFDIINMHCATMKVVTGNIWTKPILL